MRPAGLRLLGAFVLAFGACMLAFARPAHASSDIALQVVPPNPQAGEVFRLYYRLTIEDETDPEVLPFDFGGLEVIGDPAPPSVGGGMLMFGGGGFGMRGGMRGGMRVSMQTSGAYLLRARAPGRYRISNIKVVSSGTQRLLFQRAPVVITVGGVGTPVTDPASANTDADADAGNASHQPLESPDAPPRGDLTGAQPNAQAFVRVALDPPEPYLGQQVTLRVWLYAPTSETRCELSREPALTGFWNQTLDDGGGACASQWFTREVGGRYMAAGLIRKIALFPSQTGTLTVGALAVNLETVTSNPWNPVVRMQATSPELEVHVRDAPADSRPARYVPGTVGPVLLNATVDRAEVPVGETVTLSVRAESQGSLASANVELPAHVDGLRVRPGGVRAFHRVENGRVINTLLTEILLVPERPGVIDPGAVEIPYWDPVAGRYNTAGAIVPTLRATGAALPSDRRPQEYRDPAMELRPMVDAPALRAHTVVFRSARAALATVVLPPALLAFGAAGTMLARRLQRRRRDRDDERRADPDAALGEARDALASDPARAIALAGRALDRAEAREKSQREGGLDALGPAARQALEEARRVFNAARFAGENTGEGAADVLAHVERAIAALDQDIEAGS